MSKFCYSCGKFSKGDDPKFCNFCGATYGVKLCARGHKNPRTAEVCSQCGSRDLSNPGPKIPVGWQLLSILVYLGLGLLLFYTTLKLLEAMFLTPEFQQLLVLFAMLLAGLWALWTKLPDWLKETIRWLWRKSDEE